MHSDTEYRPIEFPVSHLLQNLDQSMAFRATTLFTIDWRPVHNFLLMGGLTPWTSVPSTSQNHVSSFIVLQ